MKSENERIELNVIKGILGINDKSGLLYHKRSSYLEHLSYYNDYKTRYNINKMDVIFLGFGGVHSINKNGKELRVILRRMKIWKMKIKE